MSRFSAFLLGTLIVLALGGAGFAQAGVQYDPILEWNGPYFRSINTPTLNQMVNDPVIDIPFVQSFGVAAREHAANERDVVYVLDAGNNRVQAFEANGTYSYYTQVDLTYQSSGAAAASEWDSDQIFPAQWAPSATASIVPHSQSVSIDGVTWTWVSSLAGFVAADRVYTIDFDDAVNAPEILFPGSSLSATSTIALRYAISNEQTGAVYAFGLGDVDYGTGAGPSPVLTEIDEASGGPSSWQQLRALAVIQNESTATSDDIFVVDAADDSGSQDQELFFYTVAVAGTVTAGEQYDDVLTNPYDVAVARAGASTGATVTPSGDGGPFDQATAAVSDANQVTGHTYDVTVSGGLTTITDLSTGRVLVTGAAFAELANPFLGIPGLSLPLNGAVGVTITIATTVAVNGRYIFAADTGGDRIKVIAGADGAGTSFAGDWLPGDARTQNAAQPTGAGLVGAVATVDYRQTTPVSVPEDWVSWTATAPIKEGTLTSITFDPAGTPVVWDVVGDITTAGPNDEVFEVNWANGAITFGDGIHGSVPPVSTAFDYNYTTTPDVLRYGSSGTGNGRFSAPRGVAARWNTNLGAYDVYVADTGNNRIQKLNFYPADLSLNLPARMVFICSWNTGTAAGDNLDTPVDVVVQADAATPNLVYVAVADQGNDRVVLYRDTAAAGAGGSTVPTYDSAVGGQGNVLGRYAELSGISFLTNGLDLDLYVADGLRNMVTKYEEAPTPTIIVSNFTTLPACYLTNGSFTFTIVTTNAPSGGWIDFYYDTASTYSATTSKLCIAGGTVSGTASSATWNLADTPGGPPADNDSYYLFAMLKDSSGNSVATDQTTSFELFCVDSSILPGLSAADAIDGDRAIYLQNGLERVVNLQVSYPDSVIAVGYTGAFDPMLVEIVEITDGNAWDGSGATGVVFNSSFNNTAGSYSVAASAVGTPIGLTGNGPHTVARVLLRAKASAITPAARFKNGSLSITTASSYMRDIHNESPSSWKVRGADLRLAYLGDVASNGAGADSTLPNYRPRPDGLINFEDQMVFTEGWNGNGTTQDFIADFGPTTGSAPDMLPVPDQVLDVDDILAFTTQWSWAASNGFLRVAPGSDLALLRSSLNRPEALGADVVGSARVTTVAHVESPLPGSTLTVDLIADGYNLQGAWLNLGYDPTQLEPLEVRSGDHFSGANGSLFLHRAGSDWLEVSVSKLDRESPTVSGRGVVAQVTFRILETATSDFDLVYDLRGAGNQVLSRGRGQLEPLAGGPAAFQLYANYPNPVMGSTNILFALPGTAGVSLEVFDASGRQVRSLARGTMEAGYHAVSFDGRSAGGELLPAGVYFYRLSAGEQVSTRKLILAH